MRMYLLQSFWHFKPLTDYTRSHRWYSHILNRSLFASWFRFLRELIVLLFLLSFPIHSHIFLSDVFPLNRICVCVSFVVTNIICESSSTICYSTFVLKFRWQKSMNIYDDGVILPLGLFLFLVCSFFPFFLKLVIIITRTILNSKFGRPNKCKSCLTLGL